MHPVRFTRALVLWFALPISNSVILSYGLSCSQRGVVRRFLWHVAVYFFFRFIILMFSIVSFLEL